MARPELFAAVDFGASRVLCLLAEREASGRLRLIGVGAQSQRLTLAGPIAFDAEHRAEALRLALAQAERMAGGARIESALALISDPELQGVQGAGRVALDGRTVALADVAGALRAAAPEEAPGAVRLHLAPLGYDLDGEALSDPRGSAGQALAAKAVCVHAPATARAAAAEAFEEAGVAVERVLAAPYAAALAVTTCEERQTGVAVVEIGAETTAVTRFAHGMIAGLASFSFGGRTLTAALADTLDMPFAAAERLKLMHAGWTAGPATVEALRRNVAGRLEPGPVERARLSEILGPLLEGAFARIKALPGLAGTPLVLTGGSAELAGIEALAAASLGAPARIGRPLAFPELEAAAAGAGLSAAAGAFAWRVAPPPEARLGAQRMAPRRPPVRPPLPALGAAWSWLRANF